MNVSVGLRYTWISFFRYRQCMWVSERFFFLSLFFNIDLIVDYLIMLYGEHRGWSMYSRGVIQTTCVHEWTFFFFSLSLFIIDLIVDCLIMLYGEHRGWSMYSRGGDTDNVCAWVNVFFPLSLFIIDLIVNCLIMLYDEHRGESMYSCGVPQHPVTLVESLFLLQKEDSLHGFEHNHHQYY